MKPITIHDVIARLKNGQGEQSLREYAAQLGVSPAFLSLIYRGRRGPSDLLLRRINVKKKQRVVTEYFAR